MGIETQAQDGESDEEGEVDLKAELISALEELEKCRRKNKKSNHAISELETQLLEAKRIEEDLNLKLKKDKIVNKKKCNEKKKILYTMEYSEDENTSGGEET